MQAFEQLGVFYLGRTAAGAGLAPAGQALLYDSADLVTHGLCVGMTGSGKTGLGIALIEEAAIDGVPVIVIDPKGDMGNLLLTFPGLSAAEFAPWVNPDDAARAGQAVGEFAAGEAARWQAGLAGWDEDGARIARLKAAADFAVYTPGSTAGLPVAVLSRFTRPDTDDAEALAERAQTTVSGLLGMAGIDADPVKSREHILLSLLLLGAWQAGESPDLAVLIGRIQQPPLQRIGVMEVDAFFPPKDRFEFAMGLNALAAAPGFAVWAQGAPLDIASLLRQPGGKPRVSIFSIAHLDDAQRMFFVSLLLGALAGWMRGQSGTTSLRALLYMDEIYGYFPPVANPPSKAPLLTLLKQGRAFGLGVVLATQNPVDLDYKGLANIGTWWLGRLQTEQDKQRLLDGLDSATGGDGFDRGAVDRLLSGLSARHFLMRNVHDHGLTLFETRWTLSYLRGPMSREDLRRLGQAAPAAVAPAPRPTPLPATVAPAPAPAAAVAAADGGAAPVLGPDIPQFFGPGGDGATLRPAVYGAADVAFVDAKRKVNLSRTSSLVALLSAGPVALDWASAQRTGLAPGDLLREAPRSATYLALPPVAARKTSYGDWSSELSRWLRTNETLELFYSPSTRLTSQPDEAERDFRARLAQQQREQRDSALAGLRAKYAPKQAALAERLRRAQQAEAVQADQARSQQFQSAISFGTTLVGALLGRKLLSSGNIGRAASAVRSVGRAVRESGDVGRAKETVAAVQQQMQALDDELATDTAALGATAGGGDEQLETVTLLPRSGSISVKLLALVWLPVE
jgi:hypothetical protein